MYLLQVLACDDTLATVARASTQFVPSPCPVPPKNIHASFPSPSCEWDSEGEAMRVAQRSWDLSSPAAILAPDQVQWYAVHTRARHEKMVAERLREQGMESFLPLVKQTHLWSDRQKTVELPLFSCYVFARMAAGGKDRLRVSETQGVLQIVGTRAAGLAIPDQQIDAVRMLLAEQLPCSNHPFLKIGQRGG